MESLNLGETHQNEDISKAKSNGAKGCTFCEAKTYVQPNFFGAFYPSLPRSNVCQDNCHDLIFRQPCFFNPQFLHPHVCDNTLQNYCCNHDLNQNSKPNIGDKATPERCHIRRMLTPHIFCEKMKIREKNSISEPEPKDDQSKESKEHEWSYRGCNCGESLPWTSSPFIVPVMSYCILWNSQNDNCSNYYCQLENLSRTNAGDFSNAESNEKCNKQDRESESVRDCSDDEKRKNKKEMDIYNKSSSSIASLISSQDESKIYNIKEESSCPSIKDGSNINSDEEASVLQIKSSNSSRNSQSHLSTKSTEKVLPSNAEYCVIFSAENESQRSSITGSEFDLKAKDSSMNVEEPDDRVKCVGLSSEENSFISPKISLEIFEENNLEETNPEVLIELRNVKSTAAPKKLIKNFTMTSRTEDPFQEKSQSAAAGGDLGGNTFPVFKVDVGQEESQPENASRNPRAKDSEMKRITLSGLEGKKPVKVSGIARLIQDKKTTDTKNTKRESNCKDEKRKCYPNETRIGEESFQFLKISPRMTRQTKMGSEKQNSEAASYIKKKGKKYPAPRIRPHNCDRNTRKERNYIGNVFPRGSSPDQNSTLNAGTRKAGVSWERLMPKLDLV